MAVHERVSNTSRRVTDAVKLLLAERAGHVRDPRVLQQVCSRRPEFVIQFKRELKEVDGIGRNVRRDRGLCFRRSDLAENGQVSPAAQTEIIAARLRVSP